MVLKNKLYFIESSRKADDEYVFDFRLNSENIIYKAHFPEEPITPGVCLLQIAVELLSECVGEKLTISKVKNVKFLNILTPDDSSVTAHVRNIVNEDARIKAQVEILVAETAIAKMSLVCQTSRSN